MPAGRERFVGAAGVRAEGAVGPGGAGGGGGCGGLRSSRHQPRGKSPVRLLLLSPEGMEGGREGGMGGREG